MLRVAVEDCYLFKIIRFIIIIIIKQGLGDSETKRKQRNKKN